MRVGRDEIVHVGSTRLRVDGSANVLMASLGGVFTREVVFYGYW